MIQDSAAQAPSPLGAGLFQATQWSLILRAKDNESHSAMGMLCESYRRPLLVWLRGQGYRPADAEDVLQGFLLNLLRRDFLKNVGPEKGKFRTFLLSCLKNYARDLAAERQAAKRGGGESPLSLNELDIEGKPMHEPAASQPAPDLEFDRAWAQSVLANALRQLESECSRQGHAALCAELQPVMFADETASPYREIGARLGMSEGAVKVAALRIRTRLKGLVREQVLQTVANESDWEQEVRYLLTLFAR